MKEDELYLAHILDCITAVQEFVTGGKDVFLHDRKTRDAVLRNLQTMAESTQRLSSDLKASQPGIDWRGISGFRNVLAHDYLGVDLEYVWHIVQARLPGLRTLAEAVLADPGK